MFNFSVNRKNNSVSIDYSIDHYLPWSLRTKLVKFHFYVGFSPDNGGYVVSAASWKVEDLLDECSELEFDAFHEVWQDTRLTEYVPETGERRWKI